MKTSKFLSVRMDPLDKARIYEKANSVGYTMTDYVLKLMALGEVAEAGGDIPGGVGEQALEEKENEINGLQSYIESLKNETLRLKELLIEKDEEIARLYISEEELMENTKGAIRQISNMKDLEINALEVKLETEEKKSRVAMKALQFEKEYSSERKLSEKDPKCFVGDFIQPKNEDQFYEVEGVRQTSIHGTKYKLKGYKSYNGKDYITYKNVGKIKFK